MTTIKHLFHIDAPQEKVYQALTTIDGLSNWWTKYTSGETALREIIEFSFGTPLITKMKVISLVPDQLVRWECIDGLDDWKKTIVSFQLGQNEGKTLVRFEHDKWKKANDLYAACSFSWSRYLESLRQLCQTGNGQAFGTEGYRK